MGAGGGQTGEEDPWAKCGQGESKLDLSLIKPRRPETEIEVIRQRNPKEEGGREQTFAIQIQMRS